MSDTIHTASIKQSHISEWATVIQAVDNEAKINISDDGWRTQIVDPANVAFIETVLHDGAFTSYGVDESDGDGFVYGGNITRISDVTGMGSSDSTVHFDLPDRTKMNIQAGGVSYNLNGINPDTMRQEPEIPAIDFTTTATGVNENRLSRAVEAADMVADQIRFVADPDDETFTAHARGDTDNVDVDLTEQTDSLDIEDQTEVSISLDYLRSLVRAIPSGASVSIQAKTDFPIRFDFTHADGHADTLMLIAPRIESQ
jgi:proliferating cell nuclear antigen